MYLKITSKFRIELEKLERQRKMEESDEGLGHSGSSDDEKPVKKEGTEGENMELDENGKRKEDLYQCRYCDRTFCYLCHLKVSQHFLSTFFETFFNKSSIVICYEMVK